ncbi:MAG: hypothetical protein ABIG92_03115 [Candidatus Omnitrophota bacterium]
MASIEDFKKLSIKIGRIEDVQPHPNADRLYIVTLDTGEGKRQVVAGIKNYYKEEELKDKLVAFVENLEPAMIRGIESNGMILAAQDGERLAVISPEKEVALGATVK